jgi:hypothetical protein
MTSILGVLIALYFAVCITVAILGFQHEEPTWVVGGILGATLIGAF